MSSYVFIGIIGSYPDRNENSNKIDGYYQTTNRILVHYFAINFLNIDLDDIKIYACDNEVLDAPYLSQKLYDFEYPPHQNIEIISSTDYKHRCLSSISIRTNKVTKVYPGGPAMGSFIKEKF